MINFIFSTSMVMSFFYSNHNSSSICWVLNFPFFCCCLPFQLLHPFHLFGLPQPCVNRRSRGHPFSTRRRSFLEPRFDRKDLKMSNWNGWLTSWVYIGVVFPPNHPFVHRVFHEIFTIHFGVPLFLETPSWWFQPISKIWWSNWIISPIFGVKIKNLWKHHLVDICCRKRFQLLSLLIKSYENIYPIAGCIP